MQTVVIIYLLAAFVVSVAILITGVTRARARAAWLAYRAEFAQIGGALPDANASADVGDAAVVALDRLMATVWQRSVTVDLAISPGLLVRESAFRMTDVLERMLRIMLTQVDQRLVVSAAAQGNQIMVRVAIDAPRTDLQRLRTLLEPLSGELSLRGAVLSVDTLPHLGSCLTLRIAAAGATHGQTPAHGNPARSYQPAAAAGGKPAADPNERSFAAAQLR